MSKVCLVIGSVNYSSADLSNLDGCKVDAENIFECLTNPSIGECDQENSYLLLSPTLQEATDKFSKILLENPSCEVFTICFSGHGIVKSGNLYLCMENTDLRRLSTTALPLSTVFSIIKEASPVQTNIVIDACQSGGVVFDLSNIVNPEHLGAKETSGISILASAASDQNAGETNVGGGYASSELVKCLKGENRVQSHSPFLNLIEVGNLVSDAVSNSIEDQTPVVWGLNLTGGSFLARNPHFEGSALPYSYGLASIPAGSPTGKIIQAESANLWEMYQHLPERLNTRNLVDAIIQPCEKLGKEKGVISSFVYGITQSLPSRASAQSDLFAETQALACCIVGLLPFTNIDAEAEETVLDLSANLSNILQDALTTSYESLVSDKFSLLSTKGGTCDLFVLPLRISKLLGWASAHAFISNTCGVNVAESIDILQKISKFIAENYQSSTVAISDTQSPFLLCTFLELGHNNLDGIAEDLFGTFFNSYLSHRGLIADVKIAPNKIMEFLCRRNANNYSKVKGLYAQPDELLSVLLYATNLFSLQDVVDPYLEQIDHHPFNIYLPDDYTEFGASSIRNGSNITFQIGYEHGLGVFQTSDFMDGWIKECVPQIEGNPKANSSAIRISALLASLLFPDRSAWLTTHTEQD